MHLGQPSLTSPTTGLGFQNLSCNSTAYTTKNSKALSSNSASKGQLGSKQASPLHQNEQTLTLKKHPTLNTHGFMGIGCSSANSSPKNGFDTLKSQLQKASPMSGGKISSSKAIQLFGSAGKNTQQKTVKNQQPLSESQQNLLLSLSKQIPHGTLNEQKKKPSTPTSETIQSLQHLNQIQSIQPEQYSNIFKLHSPPPTHSQASLETNTEQVQNLFHVGLDTKQKLSGKGRLINNYTNFGQLNQSNSQNGSGYGVLPSQSTNTSNQQSDLNNLSTELPSDDYFTEKVLLGKVVNKTDLFEQTLSSSRGTSYNSGSPRDCKQLSNPSNKSLSEIRNGISSVTSTYLSTSKTNNTYVDLNSNIKKQSCQPQSVLLSANSIPNTLIQNQKDKESITLYSINNQSGIGYPEQSQMKSQVQKNDLIGPIGQKVLDIYAESPKYQQIVLNRSGPEYQSEIFEPHNLKYSQVSSNLNVKSQLLKQIPNSQHQNINKNLCSASNDLKNIEKLISNSERIKVQQYQQQQLISEIEQNEVQVGREKSVMICGETQPTKEDESISPQRQQVSPKLGLTFGQQNLFLDQIQASNGLFYKTQRPEQLILLSTEAQNCLTNKKFSQPSFSPQPTSQGLNLFTKSTSEKSAGSAEKMKGNLLKGMEEDRRKREEGGTSLLIGNSQQLNHCSSRSQVQKILSSKAASKDSRKFEKQVSKPNQNDKCSFIKEPLQVSSLLNIVNNGNMPMVNTLGHKIPPSNTITPTSQVIRQDCTMVSNKTEHVVILPASSQKQVEDISLGLQKIKNRITRLLTNYATNQTNLQALNETLLKKIADLPI